MRYVTLAMASLQRKELPGERKEKKPYRHVPSLLLGQMARDKRHKGKGVGKIMVDFVIARFVVPAVLMIEMSMGNGTSL